MRKRLSVYELANALYEGTTELSNLAEECARKYGKAEALSFFDLMGDDVRNFWMSIAEQIINHSEHWLSNKGSCCILDQDETKRLKELQRVVERR